MQTSNFSKAGVMAIIHSLITVVSWKFYLRAKGAPIAFLYNNALWVGKRAIVYEPLNYTMLFIGSSRIKPDLDVQTWESINWRSFIQKSYQYTSGRKRMIFN